MVNDTGMRLDAEWEPELAPLVCPKCSAEVDHEPWPQACLHCQHPIDLNAQFAYCRGVDAFSYGQEILLKIPNKKRRMSLTTEAELTGVEYYKQAYSSLQVAFEGELAESQRQLGIKMMAAISNVFRQHGIISQLEANYWAIILTELNSQLEYVTLLGKLKKTTLAGLSGLIRRWRWYLRMKQLKKALVQLEVKARFFEQNMAFVERQHARRKLDIDKLKG